MKKINLLICFIVISITISAQSIGIGIGTGTPDASAMLDVTSSSKGMLVHRMLFTQRNLIPSPATGLLIYQTDNSPGYYYYNGTTWTQLSAGSNGWNLTGNSGSNPGSSKIK